MASVLNHQYNVFLFRKFDSNGHVVSARGIDGVKWIIAQLTGWVERY